MRSKAHNALRWDSYCNRPGVVNLVGLGCGRSSNVRDCYSCELKVTTSLPLPPIPLPTPLPPRLPPPPPPPPPPSRLYAAAIPTTTLQTFPACSRLLSLQPFYCDRSAKA
ncbi:hypothetical protein ElyMa_004224800 [Elysia marginata]|uniref:Uncharacterized protein n=1 Tax=Elysia marginata TaxID=1093978 RepID=A0AAV4GT15_9GAST|nr:hypothetical protein ElyMa_004224800 [Elysia marginata]